MGGSKSGYIFGPIQMAAGAGLTYAGMGSVGIPLITAGLGETIGQGAGGQKGAGLGELSGGLAGGLGEGGAGLLGYGPLGSSLAVGPFQQNAQAGAAGAAAPSSLSQLGSSFLKSPAAGPVTQAGLNATGLGGQQQPQQQQPRNPPGMPLAQPPPQTGPITPAVTQVPQPPGATPQGQQMALIQQLLQKMGGTGTPMG